MSQSKTRSSVETRPPATPDERAQAQNRVDKRAACEFVVGRPGAAMHSFSPWSRVIPREPNLASWQAGKRQSNRYREYDMVQFARTALQADNKDARFSTSHSLCSHKATTRFTPISASHHGQPPAFPLLHPPSSISEPEEQAVCLLVYSALPFFLFLERACEQPDAGVVHAPPPLSQLSVRQLCAHFGVASSSAQSGQVLNAKLFVIVAG